MAGIGFEIRKMLATRPGLFSNIRSYVSAGMISSGPWIMTTITLCFVNLSGGYAEGAGASETFRALVTYAFALSLITVGSIQMAVTRSIADYLYSKQHEYVLPAFTATFSVVGVAQIVIGVLFCWIAGFPASTAFVFAFLFTITGLIWLALTWLSVIREFNQILVAYCLGMVASIGLMTVWGNEAELNTYLGAYTAGQALTLTLLVRLLVRGTEVGDDRNFAVLKSPLTYPQLVGTSLFYAIAIWIDKILFWFKGGVSAGLFVYYHPLYDTCCFLAYATVIPALAINLIHLETTFYRHYRGYYQAILRHMPRRLIAKKREKMLSSLRDGMVRLVKIQGAISIGMVVCAPYLIEPLGLPEFAVRVFRFACFGAFFHILLLITILIQLYFELRWQSLVSAASFLVLNASLTWWSIDAGFAFYGAGYAAAALVSATLALLLLYRALQWLDYKTFAGQIRTKS